MVICVLQPVHCLVSIFILHTSGIAIVQEKFIFVKVDPRVHLLQVAIKLPLEGEQAQMSQLDLFVYSVTIEVGNSPTKLEHRDPDQPCIKGT